MNNYSLSIHTNEARDNIRQIIVLLDEGNHLNHNLILQLSSDLTDFILAAVQKFIAGQREHGGNLIDRDLLEELQKEQIDSFWYTSFLKRKLENEAYERATEDIPGEDN